MSSVFSKGQGRKQMRGTDSAIADKQIAAAGASPTSEGLKRSAASIRLESHGPLSGKGRSRNRNAGLARRGAVYEVQERSTSAAARRGRV
jgi:hypothetical protein